MDQISASALNLHAGDGSKAAGDKTKEETFREIIVSCKSLSHYESKSFRSSLPQIFAAVIAASFHIVLGISLAYSAILVPQLEAEDSDIPATKTETSWIASVIVLIVPIGALFAGFSMEYFGRLTTIKLATIPGAAGYLLMAMATNVPMLLVGRILTGIASTLGSSPAIVYITEIASPELRGSLISMCPTLASLGMVMAYLKGWYMSWRTVAWITAVYNIIPAILIFCIPDSPVWLMSKGRIDDASKSLQWFNKLQPQPEQKTETLAELQLQVMLKERDLKKADEKTSSHSSLQKFYEFKKPTGYKPMMILFFLFFFQQFSGIYITLFYAVTFFENVGSTFDPYLASTLVGTIRFLMSMVNTWLLKSFKRRVLVMTSCVGMTICMAVSGTFTLWIHQKKTDMSWVPIMCLLLYVVTSMIGLLTIPWTMTAELFPTKIRGIAHSIAYSMANLIMFAAVQLYRDLEWFLGGPHAIQWFFAVVSIFGAVYAWIFLPETHGKKLTEIQKYFETNTIYLGQKKKNLGDTLLNVNADLKNKNDIKACEKLLPETNNIQATIVSADKSKTSPENVTASIDNEKL